MFKKFLLVASAGLMAIGTAAAAEKVKIGFVTTITTPAGVIGKDMVDAVNLAMEDIGGKMAGRDVELIIEDDGFKPAIGKQKTDKLVKQDKVQFVTGFIWSHVLLASQKSALGAGKFLISSNAGPSQMAGKLCHKNFFSTSWQNDQTPMAMGEVLNLNNVKSLYVMAPNYAAGKNMVSGVARTFKGKIVGKDLTKWGKDAQLDFSAELAKAKASGAEGIFVFYPGKAGGAFIKQYAQAGLQGKIPLYSVFTVDSIALPKLQKANMSGVMGSVMTQFWAPDLDTPQNKKFVSGFKKKYGRYPSFYAAQSYDTIFLIKSAVEAVKGDLSNIDGMRAAMKTANFPSVRGKFSYGNNHFPIQNFYSRKVVKDSEGVWTTSVQEVVLKNHQDTYAKDCSM
ncbi:MAG: ABC transporter substrate-binding protein [Nisaea sp.]|jgi:branched-chain amino acid transport system substrate-binding protein|nr:ABC transporter substrate-binding protein [Rhodospirillaceae bacterium]MCH2629823.1 ABC transporter substrate-binding protein [Nisaea sp.]MEC7806326.1 ABC transporter substrate-binding protein [Pseudomonadota bacterium]MEC7973590.1 ABC transporter substrate-binding protein [Pseudomonadota bacterium]MEC9101091.1 ABC transporter substrate-binding protein [Pseudomonadota bacterium]|tara:strand:- start:47 stop:1231 length:1185 start_codon:yes stop_codon:yes gene_type:complete